MVRATGPLGAVVVVGRAVVVVEDDVVVVGRAVVVAPAVVVGATVVVAFAVVVVASGSVVLSAEVVAGPAGVAVVDDDAPPLTAVVAELALVLLPMDAVEVVWEDVEGGDSDEQPLTSRAARSTEKTRTAFWRYLLPCFFARTCPTFVTLVWVRLLFGTV